MRSVKAGSMKSRRKSNASGRPDIGNMTVGPQGGTGSLFGFGPSGGEGASLADSIRGSLSSRRSKSVVGLAEKNKPMPMR